MIERPNYDILYSKIRAAGPDEQVPADTPIPEFTFQINPKDIFYHIFEAVDRLKNNYSNVFGQPYGNNQLWFRGQQDGRKPLLPPLLRGNRDVKPASALKERMRDFKFMAASVLEEDCAELSNADYLAMMQHCGAETNLLGFDTTITGALYYAFQKYVEHDKPGAVTTAIPTLFIFCPELYNYALSQLVKKFHTSNACYSVNKALFSLMEDFSGPYSLPYLSGIKAESPYSLFLYREEDESLLGFKEDSISVEVFPIAVHIAHPHSPIRSTANCFLAYNNYVTYPARETSGITIGGYRMNDLSLESIQKLYLSHIRNSSPFLYQLRFPIETAADGIFISSQLKAIGIQKENHLQSMEGIGKKVAERYSIYC